MAFVPDDDLPVGFGNNPKVVPQDDLPGAKDRSYIGASASSGWNTLKAAGAKILEEINPFTTSEEDLAVLYKNDPSKLKDITEKSAATVLSRYAQEQTARAASAMQEVDPSAKGAISGKPLSDLEYATLDPEKAAYLSPTRIAGDVLQSLPTTLALGVSAYLTKGRSLAAYEEASAAALAKGLAKSEADQLAKAAAMKVGAETMAKTGAVGEGVVGYAQQSNQTLSDAKALSDDKWAESSDYKSLLDNGYSPDAAKMLLSNKAAERSGILAGAIDAGTNLVGGRILGKVIGEGGSLIPRVAKGFAGESATEFVQSGGEQFASNLALQQIDPTQSLSSGVLESAVAGGVVGGVTGGGFAGVLGSRQREVTTGDVLKSPTVDTAIDAAVQAADLDLKTSLVPELASDIDAYNAASLRSPALNPSDALELAAAKGAMDRVGSLDLSQPAAIAAPASAVTEAGDSAAREVEAAGGVATPAQAAILDRAFPGQKMYDQVVGSSEQVPTVSNNSPIIIEPGRAPREAVSFANPLQAENAEGWNRWNADRQKAAPMVDITSEPVSNIANVTNVQNVIEALQTAPALQSAEQRVTLNAARQNLSPGDFQLLETAAQGRFNLSAEQKIRLNTLENQSVFPQTQETLGAQENQATLSSQRADEQEAQLPQAELIYSPEPMGEGYRLIGTRTVNGRQMYVYADRSVTPSVTPAAVARNETTVANSETAVPEMGMNVPEMGTTVPNNGTTAQAAETFTPKKGVATLESTATGNDEVGSTGTVNSDGKAYQYRVVESGVAPGVSGAIRQLARLFGKKVVFFNSDLAADGFVQPGKGSAIYINANSKMSPLAVFGHELMHLLKRDNPIAYKAVAAVVGRNLKGDAASKFRDYYNAEGPSQNSELTDAELEEMVADLMGNEFTQESFLSDVFNEIGQMAPEGQARSIILRLAATINKAIKAALNVIKGMPVSQAFDTDQMVNNLEEIRAALKSALKTYAIQQKESAAKMAMEFTREESSVNLESQEADATGEATLTARRANETIGEFGVKNYKDGTIFVQGEAERIRNMLPDGVVGRPVPGGVLFSHTVAPRVKAALDENKLAYSRAGQVIDKLPMKDGKYIGAPEKFNTPGKITTLRKWLRTLTMEGAPGRYWYENSGREVLKMVGGDIQEARKFVALLAIYSPQAKVDANSTFALRAWAQYKAGQPISVKTGVMDDKAQQALDDVEAFWSGEKTGNFFNNLLREIDLSTEGKQGATIDMWMMRAGQYDTDAPTPTQYAFMENETNRLAAELGWEPQQVQAAIWVAMKARMENAGVKKATEATSEKKKWIRFDYVEKNGKKVKQRVILDEKKHRDNWLKHAFNHDPSQDDTEQAKFDFGDGLKRHLGQLSFEARPGRSTNVLPGIHDATYEQQMEFQRDVQNAFLEEDGTDRLAQLLGLLVDTSDIMAPGVWQGEVSPSSQKLIAMAPAKGKDGKTSVDPAQAKALNAYAAIRGLLAYQEGVGWHRPFYAAAKRDSNGLDINIGRPITPAEATSLGKALDVWMQENNKGSDWNNNFAIISSNYGVRLVNFGVISNQELQRDVFAVAETVLPDFTADWFASSGDMPTNDWKEFPNGQGYIERASTEGSPDVLEWARDILAPRVKSVFEEYSRKYDWGYPGDFKFSPARSNAASSGRNQGSNAEAARGVVEYGQPTEGSVTALGVHYSRQVREVLDSKFHGTGLKGEEGRRLAGVEDKRLKNRIYFYVDSGKGVKPESGVGSYPHEVKLNNLYDANAGRTIQNTVNRMLTGDNWFSEFESAVIDAGFDGYVVNFGDQRAAVLLGDHTVDMAQKQESKEVKLSTPRFYSQLERTIEQVPERLKTQPAAQWKAWLASNSAKFGIKKDEIEWSGINDYLTLRGKDKVTAEEIGSFLDLNNVKINEVVKGGGQAVDYSEVEELPIPAALRVVESTYEDYEFEVRTVMDYRRVGLGYSEQDALSDAYSGYPEYWEGMNPANGTKYGQWVLPGGDNYTEMLLTLPDNNRSRLEELIQKRSELEAPYQKVGKDIPDSVLPEWRALNSEIKELQYSPNQAYRSSHWDESNILAHIRMNDRTDANGNKVLFVEEIQSDWAQAGRKGGIRGELSQEAKARVEELRNQRIELDRQWRESDNPVERRSLMERANEISNKVEEIEGPVRGAVPAAPFISNTKDWLALAVKRVMLLAAQGDYDKVAFVNGQQSADRYNLAKQIDYIEYEKTDTNEWFIKAMDRTGRSAVTEYGQTPEKLESLVGKEIAQKIVNNEGTREPGEPATYGVLRNTQLSVGGEGMKSFYDRIVPQVVNDVLKKLGGRTETVSLEYDPNVELDQWVPEDGDGDGSKADISKTEQVGFSVAPDMREKLQGEGLPLFSKQRYNASGNLIYPTQNGQDNFWKWIDGIRRGGLETPGVSGEGRGRAESASARTAGLGDGFFFDDAGRPKVLFHGTTTAIDEFDLDHPNKKDAGWLGKGVYLTSDIDMAEGYANLKGNMRNQTIMPVYAYLRNPYLFTADEKQALSKAGKDAIAAFTKSAQAKGYDGGVLEFDDGTYEVVVFDNKQVKSASGNDGSFDLNSAKLSTSRQTVADVIAGHQFKQEIVNQAKYKLADIIAPGNGFNWFHKTVGTQFHKAKVNPLFKKVFDLGQQFLDDVTLFATRAEDKAADIFPRFGLSKSLLKTGLSKSDNQLIARALTDGTLENGADPHTGVVWSDEDLRSKYGMNDNQIGYYRQARAALDQSLDDLAKSEMATHMRIAMKANITPLIRADISLGDVRDMLIQSLDAGIASTTNEDAAKMLQKTKSQINGIYSTTTNLKNHGYAPLMRFGKYTVTAYNENGDVAFFQMTDTRSEASLMAKNLEDQFASVKVGDKSEESYKLFKGITPDTLELFAKHSALSNDALTQEYLQLAVASRSAMKRLINRKGTTGYSLDATRTLATFLTSNARKSSSALNMYDMKQASLEIPHSDNARDEAVKLVEYLQNPGEEAAKLRGFLFFQYLGGSIASGIVNLTQPILQTYPYLSQFGAGKAGAAMKTGTVAATHFLRGKRVGDPVLQAAMEKAKAEGLIDPQEIYQLMAASQSGAGSFLSYKLMRLWGINFGVTELMNRAVTFAAAFKIGQTLSKEELAKAGAKDAYTFAQGAIYETQGLYNKGNRPDWARGAVGGTIFTFKQYSISYLEFMTRLYKNDKKAFGIALAILVMASGLQGLPGADDLDDVIDTGGNWLGYATNTKKWKREFLEDVFGKEMAAFALHGVSTIPGMPIDVQARLGLGNIIPGTGLMNPTKKDKGREVAEVFGVAGGLAMSTMDTTEALARGDVRRAALSILPGAVRNLIQASEMAATGEYRDTRGRLVQKVDGGDVIAKAIGFQPAEIAAGNRRMREVQADIDIVKAKQEEVNGKYARAIVDKDQGAMAEVRAEMQDWNQKNPDLRIKFNMSAIQQRVKQARLTKEARFIKSAPQQIRQQVREAVLAD